jgi:hypothetical protein
LHVADPFAPVTERHRGIQPTAKVIVRSASGEPRLVSVALTFPKPTPNGGGKMTSCGAAVKLVGARVMGAVYSSASETKGPSPPLAPTPNDDPTAVQFVVVAHDTPWSALLCAPGGLGDDWTLQLVPSQASARVSW